MISIHALREEGDVILILLDVQHKISIHALREEGDDGISTSSSVSDKFLSTPSARRATASVSLLLFPLPISIHALREEGDGSRLWKMARAVI